MDHLTCDRCGKGLLLDEDVRYEVRIQVKSAYDPLELTADEIARDHAAEMRALLEKMKSMDAGDLEDQVHKEFELDLCAACQRDYIRDPLARKISPPHVSGPGPTETP